MSGGLASGSRCVARGGCWEDTPQFAQVAFRSGSTPGARYDYVGFRLMRRVS